MDVLMRDTFKLVETKLNAFLSSLTSSPTAANAPAAAIELLNADDALTRALETLRLHQQNYARLLALNKEARLLESKVKDTVKDVLSLSEEIAEARCDGEDEGESDTDSDEEDERQSDVKAEHGDTHLKGLEENATPPAAPPIRKALKPRKEIDYHLLLNFARRISRFSCGEPNEGSASLTAAAHVDLDSVELLKEQTPIPSPPPPQHSGPDAESTPSSSATSLIEAYKGSSEPNHHLPPSAKAWLDETANWIRESSKLPFPNEEKIRMGIMGRLQVSAVVDGPDPESEVERMMAEVEKDMRAKHAAGRDDSLPMVGLSPSHHAYLGEPGDDGVHSGIPGGIGGNRGTKPKPAVFDLDLFDASDEEV